MSSTSRLTASRVGVITQRVPGSHDCRACERCGHERQVRYGTVVPLCQDCKLVDPNFGKQRAS